MVENKSDDLEAVRTIATALEPFQKTDQERILRWVREKIGLPLGGLSSSLSHSMSDSMAGQSDVLPQHKSRDIKSFVLEKAPKADTHFAATVSYFYRFEAPETNRKVSITAEDLQDAARKVGRARLKDPGQALRNAVKNGIMDNIEKGAYTINTVGENLVAMTLPSTVDKSRSAVKRAVKKTKKKMPERKKAK
ncbi:MAG TPA: hypothetical protein VJZ16_02215 [Syntrophales bacterium]|nr:hypothetical protein [Syntrophales bacterium]